MKEFGTTFWAVEIARLYRDEVIKSNTERMRKCDKNLYYFVKQNLVDKPYLIRTVKQIAEVYRICGNTELYNFYSLSKDERKRIWAPSVYKYGSMLRIRFTPIR